jgi:hypothetical protein
VIDRLRRPSVQLALWTLFVWGVRIKNAEGSIGAIALSLTFVALAVLVLAFGDRFVAATLAGWTVVVWVVRMVDIVFLSDRSGAFTAVHAGLGLVSLVLAARVGGEVAGAVAGDGQREKRRGRRRAQISR